MVYWLAEISFKDSFIFSSGGHAEQNILINLGRRHHVEQFFKIILNLDHLFRRRGHLKIFLIYSSGGLYVQCFQTICAIMVVSPMWNISVKQY